MNLAAFPLWVELLLLPAVVLVSASSAATQLRPETRNAKPILDRLSAILGLLVLAGTALYVASNWTADR